MEREEYSSPKFAHVAGGGSANFSRRHPRARYGVCRHGGAWQPRRRDSRVRNDAVCLLHVQLFVTGHFASKALIFNEIRAGRALRSHGRALRLGFLQCGGGSELCTAADGTLFISIDFQLITFNLLNRGGCRRDSCERAPGMQPANRRGLGHLSARLGMPRGPQRGGLWLEEHPDGAHGGYLFRKHALQQGTHRPPLLHPQGCQAASTQENGSIFLIKKGQ